jgi:F420-non-reducing hydrogenase small subunit
MPVKAKGSKSEKPHEKLKIGMYWASSCGGCEIALLEIGENILTLAEEADLLFCPCLLDFKYDDVRAMPDEYLDVVFFNGGIRNDEQEEIAKLLRRKAKVLVAFGACAHMGGVPGLANLYTLDSLLSKAFLEGPSIDNPDKILPDSVYEMPEGIVGIPPMHETVKPLEAVVPVDYTMPGCPPIADRIWESILAIVQEKLPERGSIIGAGEKSVCDECPFPKKDKKIQKFYRTHEKKPEQGWCLLEQGFVCMGPATRSGCEARCLQANMPCRGCYGPVPGADDQGAAMISAIGSLLETGDDDEAARIVNEIVDPAGTFYRFGLGASLLRKART